MHLGHGGLFHDDRHVRTRARLESSSQGYIMPRSATRQTQLHRSAAMPFVAAESLNSTVLCPGNVPFWAVNSLIARTSHKTQNGPLEKLRIDHSNRCNRCKVPETRRLSGSSD